MIFRAIRSYSEAAEVLRELCIVRFCPLLRAQELKSSGLRRYSIHRYCVMVSYVILSNK